MTALKNLLRQVPDDLDQELLETLAVGSTCRIERIVSCGQSTPEDEWFDQEVDEWVMVVSGAARLRFADGNEPLEMHAGDWINIQAHRRHRVEWTTPDEPTVWLAVHYSR